MTLRLPPLSCPASRWRPPDARRGQTNDSVAQLRGKTAPAYTARPSHRSGQRPGFNDSCESSRRPRPQGGVQHSPTFPAAEPGSLQPRVASPRGSVRALASGRCLYPHGLHDVLSLRTAGHVREETLWEEELAPCLVSNRTSCRD